MTIARQAKPAPKALVADPDPESRALYEQALGLSDFEIVYASDGREALVKVLEQPVALLITETELPLIDGYALCQLVRRDALIRTMPIMVVTTDVRQTAQRRALQAGADAVFVKPWTDGDLGAEARRLIRGEFGRAGAGGDAGTSARARGRFRRRQVARDQEPFAPALRYDRAAGRAAHPALPGVRSSVDLRLQPHRRRQRPRAGAVGLLHVFRPVRPVPVSPADPQASARLAAANRTMSDRTRWSAPCRTCYAHCLPRRRTGRALLRDRDEAARSAPRDRRRRAQPALRHVRLGRGAVGRDARQPRRQRSRERRRHPARVRLLGRHRRLLPRHA